MTDYVTMFDIDKEKCYTYAEELKKIKDKLNEVIVALNDLEASTSDLVPKAYRSDLTPTLSQVAVCSNNKYIFSISGYNPKCAYLFTYGNLLILLPAYNLQNGTTYKIVGPSWYKENPDDPNEVAGVRTLLYNVRFTKSNEYDQKIEIWSGNTNYPLLNGYTGYLFKAVNLY